LSRMLFILLCTVAFILATVALIAPWLGPKTSTDLGDRIWNLFAQDSVVRRTALACALGLVVTAYVFFRPPNFFRNMLRKAKSNQAPPPGNIAGA
jgi:cytochrome bd-type quinol oxidase subunit 2